MSEEQTNFEKLESGIDEKVADQFRSVILKLLLKLSGKLTLADLTQLTESKKYGEVASGMRLQELLDAYVESENLGPEPEVVEKPKRGRKVKSESGDDMDLRVPGARQEYEDSVSSVVEGNSGGETAASQIEEECKGSKTQVRQALKELIKSGVVVYNGKARATRYFWKAAASAEVLEAYETLRKVSGEPATVVDTTEESTEL